MLWGKFVRCLCYARLVLRIAIYGSDLFSRPAILASRPGFLFAILEGSDRTFGVMPPFSWSKSWRLFGWWFRNVPHTIDRLPIHDRVVRFLTSRHLMPHQLGAPVD